MVEVARTDRDPLSGSLRLALIPTVGPYLLPHVARRLKRALPRLQLLLYEYQTAPLLEKLRDGEIDMGILALPIARDGLETVELYDEPFRLAVPADHPLTGDFTRYPLTGTPFADYWGNWVYQDCGEWELLFDNGTQEIDGGGTNPVTLVGAAKLVGNTSGATGVIKQVIVESGSWGTANAAGRIILKDVVGTFSDNESHSR